MLPRGWRLWAFQGGPRSECSRSRGATAGDRQCSAYPRRAASRDGSCAFIRDWREEVRLFVVDKTWRAEGCSTYIAVHQGHGPKIGRRTYALLDRQMQQCIWANAYCHLLRLSRLTGDSHSGPEPHINFTVFMYLSLTNACAKAKEYRTSQLGGPPATRTPPFPLRLRSGWVLFLGAAYALLLPLDSVKNQQIRPFFGHALGSQAYMSEVDLHISEWPMETWLLAWVHVKLTYPIGCAIVEAGFSHKTLRVLCCCILDKKHANIGPRRADATGVLFAIFDC